jgi:16S rRNA (guanine527-N7)-methyltransferase
LRREQCILEGDMDPDVNSLDKERALAIVPLSRETEQRMSIFVELIGRWRQTTNLISPSSLRRIWTRHIADTAQLTYLAPQAVKWVDLGSGNGFPGLVVAICLASDPLASVHCIESDRRKCAFLREVAHATGAPAEIHCTRAEFLADLPIGAIDVVTARALASFPRTLQLSLPAIRQGAIGIFPCGRSSESTMRVEAQRRGLAIEAIPSLLDPHCKIVVVQKSNPQSPT